MTPTVLASTWSDGLIVLGEDSREHELAGCSVRSLTPDGRDGVLAIIDGHALSRRSPDGVWNTLASSGLELACISCIPRGEGQLEGVFVGTDDARVLRLDVSGQLEPVGGFDVTPGRDTWYAGQVVVNGQVMGPPLGIRSMAATCDGAALLANVHVGGIPRSIDGGASWQPTIDVDSDVHEVRAHPTDAQLVIAATAVGLGISRDGGASWVIESAGLHASYCSAVAFCGDELFVAAAADHFSAEGAVYRRAVDSEGPLQPVVGGLPRRTSGIVDTGCLATHGAEFALADKAGNLYVSEDAGASWSLRANGLTGTSSLLVV